MKKFLEKVKAFFKFIWTGIKKVVSWLFKKENRKVIYAILIGIGIMMIYKKVKAIFGKVRIPKIFSEFPGNKNKVIVHTEAGNKIVDLPENPKTGKQITSDDPIIVGYPSNYTEGDKLNVEIKHSVTDRKSVADS